MKFLLLAPTMALASFFACSTNQVDPSLTARRACFKELNDPEIRSAEAFIALGKRKQDLADHTTDAREKSQGYRCALAAYESATAAAPMDTAPFKAAGDFYLAVNAFEPATRMYRRVIELDGSNADAFWQLSLVYKATGEKAEERAALVRYLELLSFAKESVVPRADVEARLNGLPKTGK